jgi:hypothetical protein
MPTVVGVPLTIPVVDLRVTPPGNDPELIDHV